MDRSIDRYIYIYTHTVRTARAHTHTHTHKDTTVATIAAFFSPPILDASSFQYNNNSNSNNNSENNNCTRISLRKRKNILILHDDPWKTIQYVKQ
mmetsp:Transcript_31627/g.66317  ORF Transcript_31627/g.66317 Transcript_31627/m.66317 type:complete len:95 (-) Transcript_31627:35-319(-)